MTQHNVRIDADRWNAAMVKARSEGRTLTDVIDAALIGYLGRPGPPRVPPLQVDESLITTIEGTRRRKARNARRAVKPPEFIPAPESGPDAPVKPERRSVPRRCTHPGTRVIGGYCRQCEARVEPGGIISQ